MNERETTKLWFLADAIVDRPTWWRKLLEVTEEAPGLRKPSAELTTALNALEFSLDCLGSDTRGLRDAARVLLRQKGPAKDAGRALAWALENHGVVV